MISDIQVAKLLTIPFVCVMEKLWIGKQFSTGVLVSIVMSTAGVTVM